MITILSVILSFFIIVWGIYFIRDLYGFYVDYFIKEIKRKYVLGYILKSMALLYVLSLIVQINYNNYHNKQRDENMYEKTILSSSEVLLGLEFPEGTVVQPQSKGLREEGIRYIKPSKAMLYHDILVEEFNIESFIPAVHTLDTINIKLAQNSLISNFPCEKEREVEIFADGTLNYCYLSKDIRINEMDLVKGSMVKLLNENKAPHLTFDMMNKQNYDINSSFIPIWNIRNNILKEDKTLSNWNCLEGASVDILDDGTLKHCSKIDEVILDGLAFPKGCSVTFNNAEQAKDKTRTPTWRLVCHDVKVGRKTLGRFELMYSPLRDKIYNMRARSNHNKTDNLEDLLKRVRQ